jgi:hypothetical protein
MGTGQSGDAVGDAGAGGQDGERRSALELRHRLRREYRRLLVPYVHDAHAAGMRRVVDRENVPAGQREQLRHAVRPQRGQDQVAAMSFDAFRHTARGYRPVIGPYGPMGRNGSPFVNL